MSENSANVPKIRFPGFTDAWEQRRLGDIAEFNPKSYLPEQFEYVDLESVVGISLISHRTEQKETAPSRAQRLAKQGDIFYQTVRPYQKNNYLFDLPFDNYVFSTGYAQMRPYLDSYFLLSRLQEERFVSDVLDSCTGTSYPAINSNDLAQIKISVPTLNEEQIKIGTFFKQLDHLITLHQRKLNHLQAEKKSLLQKMFPKNGADFPEIRFPGFTHAWEQRKLGDETEIVAGGDIDKSKLLKTGKYPVVANALTNDGIVGYYDNDYRIEAPALTVTGRGDVGHAQARKANFTPVVRLLSVKSKHDVDFLENAINNHKVLVESTGVPQLTSPQLANYKIWFTSFGEEKKIGEFFSQLDHLITLHQRKLNNLQKQKKSLLQQMFV